MNRRRRERYGKVRSRFRRRVEVYMKIGGLVLVLILLVLTGMKLLKIGPFHEKYVEKTGEEIDLFQPEIDVQLLTVNKYSRPGTQSKRINGIVIHYTANPGSTAMQNRNYFEGLKDSHLTQASSHFIVGLEGEIVQCIPTWEIAYASNERNADTVSIETCHMTEDGSYTEATYESMVRLTAWLCKKFDLTEEDVIRHYDVTGKICPKYFVEHEEAWDAFKNDIEKALDEM